MSAEEIQRLKDKMFGLQAQVEELRSQLNIVQQHASAKDAQYAKIIEQSAQREMRNLAESKLWQSDKELWAQERRVLQETIANLNSKIRELRAYVDPVPISTTVQRDSKASQATPVKPPPSSSSVSTFTTDALATPLPSSSTDRVHLAALRREGD